MYKLDCMYRTFNPSCARTYAHTRARERERRESHWSVIMKQLQENLGFEFRRRRADFS
jgi:hypothetical protein